MTCAQCGRACFLAGCGGGESCDGGGGVWGGVISKIFDRGEPLKHLKYDPF